MKRDKVLGIFAIVLITSSILKLTGVLPVIMTAYTNVATAIMEWFAPDILSATSNITGANNLIILMPLLLLLNISLFTYKHIKYRRKTIVTSWSNPSETEGV